jgi:hypothetical protein
VPKVQKQIDALIVEYNLDRATVELVGGGGGAASLVPYTGKVDESARQTGEKAEVISTIGVALAMVRDVVERNITKSRRPNRFCRCAAKRARR